MFVHQPRRVLFRRSRIAQQTGRALEKGSHLGIVAPSGSAMHAHEAFTGQTFDEWKGDGWATALPPEARDRVIEIWRSAVAERAPIDAEYRVRHVTGEYRWTSVRAVPLRNDDGRVRGWVGMNCDITKRKQAE